MLIITLQDAVLHSYLQQLQAHLGDLSPVLDEIGNTLETNTRKRFRTFTDPEGNKWDAWQPNTRKRYPFPGTPAAKNTALATPVCSTATALCSVACPTRWASAA